MQERPPSRFRHVGNFGTKFLSEVTTSLITTACIAVGTTVYLQHPGWFSAADPQKPDLAVASTPTADASVMRLSSTGGEAQAASQPDVARLHAAVFVPPLPPARPKIMVPISGNSRSRTGSASLATPLLASAAGSAAIAAPRNPAPSVQGTDRDPDTLTANDGHIVGDHYDAPPVDQLSDVSPSPPHDGVVQRLLITPVVKAGRQSAEALHSVQDWSSSVIAELPRAGL